MKNRIIKYLILIFVLAISIRLIYFKDYATFFYDQAKDAITSMEIFEGDPVKILGPGTDILGIYHGPLYWYLISPFYYFSQGNVYLVRFFLIVINSVGVFIIYKLASDLFNNKKIAFTSALLFAISFEASQYGRWLSNPSPALISTLLSLWAFSNMVKGKKWSLPLLIFSWGISVQLQLFLLYQSVAFVLMWLLVKGFKFPGGNLKTYLLAVICFVLTFSTFFVSELKFNFRGTHSLIEYFGLQSHSGNSLINTLDTFVIRINDSFYFNLWGINPLFSRVITVLTLLFVIYLFLKNRYKEQIIILGFWMLSPFLAIFLNGPDTSFITLGMLIPIIILSVLVFYEISQKNTFVFLGILVIVITGNILLSINKNKEGEVLFDVQHKSLLGDQIRLIDWIYKEAQGKPFTINTITEPLFINSRWAFLFRWQANTKHGYMPFWWGETQVDVPGSKIKFSEWKDTDLHFLIVEPSSRSDDNFTRIVKILENDRSEVLSREKFGVFIVEKRKIKKIQRFTGTDAYNLLKNTNLEDLKKIE